MLARNVKPRRISARTTMLRHKFRNFWRAYGLRGLLITSSLNQTQVKYARIKSMIRRANQLKFCCCLGKEIFVKLQ